MISEGRLQTVSGVMKLYGHILAGVWLGPWKKRYATLAAQLECFGNQEICKQADERIPTHPCRRPLAIRGCLTQMVIPPKLNGNQMACSSSLRLYPAASLALRTFGFYAVVTFSAKVS